MMHSPCSLGMLCLLAHLLWLARRASSCFKPGTLSATLVVLAVPSPCCRGCALKAWYVHAPFFSTHARYVSFLLWTYMSTMTSPAIGNADYILASTIRSQLAGLPCTRTVLALAPVPYLQL